MTPRGRPAAALALHRVGFGGAGGTIAAIANDPRGAHTHFNEGIAKGRLSQLLAALDDALAAVKANMGSAWRETVVTLMTEFGRTPE